MDNLVRCLWSLNRPNYGRTLRNSSNKAIRVNSQIPEKGAKTTHYIVKLASLLDSISLFWALIEDRSPCAPSSDGVRRKRFLLSLDFSNFFGRSETKKRSSKNFRSASRLRSYLPFLGFLFFLSFWDVVLIRSVAETFFILYFFPNSPRICDICVYFFSSPISNLLVHRGDKIQGVQMSIILFYCWEFIGAFASFDCWWIDFKLDFRNWIAVLWPFF